MQTDHKRDPGNAGARPGRTTDEGAPADPAAAPVRSEAMLPVDRDQADDDRFAVAEEISLDQQSDRARQVGQAPDPVPGQASPSAPAAPGTLADALDSEPAPPADAGAQPKQPSKEELRLMADTLPGAGPGGD